METTKKRQGGARPGSGRPSKQDKDQWGQITCVLKRETITKLKAGAGSKHFGEFLQAHLDRYPLPTQAQYQALVHNRPLMIEIKKRRVPVIMSAGSSPLPRMRPGRVRRRLSSKEFEAAIVAAQT